jgi:uncharacterized protein (TIGR03083 family)
VDESRFAVPGDEGRLLDWYRGTLERVAGQFEAADPSVGIWTWTGNPTDTVGWVQRRMAQETAVHRWDGEAASSQQTDVDAELARDGIDEFFDVFLPTLPGATSLEGTVHLHRTDGDGEWLVTMRHGAVTVTREHAKGDVAVRGAASDLLLMLWRRCAPDGLETFGDRAVLDRFLAVVEID